ncbi:MBL fold metallo-hydrolase [Bosea sp. BH3]|uniref:MBL fold metallo-hydrolase n=1 Tax=Bosea sp. BH3 TaxID=2871701 RepID=UPI0021CB186A|nr:MBL fold metallo-hydrolase [Bosea sp. BH3]MCU4179442.1 MBL fold metallo-hydrolase [Bosea sp. BH3]
MELPVALSWFAVTRLRPDLYRITEPCCHRMVRANCFLLLGSERDLLIDTGMGVAPLRPIVASLSSRPLSVFTTHAHADHIGGHPEFADLDIFVHPLEADELRRPGVRGLRFPKRAPEQIESLRRAGIELTEFMVDAVPYPDYDIEGYGRDPVEPTRLVDEGDVVDLGDRRLEVLHVPGHSPGSIALWEEATGSLFTGDALYDGVIVDTGPGASISAYLPTMERLKRLPVTEVFGGHNDTMTRSRMITVIERYMASRSGRGR